MKVEDTCNYCGRNTVEVRNYKMEISSIHGETKTVVLKELFCTYCGFSVEHEENDLILKKEYALFK